MRTSAPEAFGAQGRQAAKIPHQHYGSWPLGGRVAAGRRAWAHEEMRPFEAGARLDPGPKSQGIEVACRHLAIVRADREHIATNPPGTIGYELPGSVQRVRAVTFSTFLDNLTAVTSIMWTRACSPSPSCPPSPKTPS